MEKDKENLQICSIGIGIEPVLWWTDDNNNFFSFQSFLFLHDDDDIWETGVHAYT